MPRYMILPSGQPAEPAGIDWNHDGIITLSERVISSVLAAVGAWVALQALFWAAGLLLSTVVDLDGVREPWLRWYAPGTALLVAAAWGALVIWRMVRLEREERDLQIETARRRRFEDETRQWTQERAAPPSTAKLTQARIDRAAWLMLQAYYQTGSMARGTVKGVTDPEWNEANALLKSARIRRGRSPALDPETLELAWSQYVSWLGKRSAYTVDADGDLRAKP